jgi:hypothetical protein
VFSEEMISIHVRARKVEGLRTGDELFGGDEVAECSEDNWLIRRWIVDVMEKEK